MNISMKKKITSVFLGISFLSLCISATELVCPCSRKDLCNPVTGPPVNPRGELYGFYGEHDFFVPARDLNFTYLTTLAWATNNDAVTCAAHEHGVRVVQGSPYVNLTNLALGDESDLLEWVHDALRLVQSKFRDGMVFDYEEPMSIDSPEARTYVKLINLTRTIFQAHNPSYQISVCVAWSPDSIDGRSYPYIDLAAVSDIVYVMVYDVQSQIMNTACIAGANSPIGAVVRGIERYIEIGVDPRKMILGVPWYGYKYPCNGSSMKANDKFCPLAYSPFRGVRCSDAVGREYPFSVIMKELRASNWTATGGLQWDDNTKSPFFNFADPSLSLIKAGNNRTEKSLESRHENDRVVYQYWFDNPQSLRIKYAWAKERGLLGVGPYEINSVNPNENSDTYRDSVEMWSAFDTFFHEPTKSARVTECT